MMVFGQSHEGGKKKAIQTSGDELSSRPLVLEHEAPCQGHAALGREQDCHCD